MRGEEKFALREGDDPGGICFPIRGLLIHVDGCGGDGDLTGRACKHTIGSGRRRNRQDLDRCQAGTSTERCISDTSHLLRKRDARQSFAKQERRATEANLKELFARMNATESEVKAQGASIQNLVATCNRIESKLDRIIEREAK